MIPETTWLRDTESYDYQIHYKSTTRPELELRPDQNYTTTIPTTIIQPDHNQMYERKNNQTRRSNATSRQPYHASPITRAENY